ncbi:Late embryogenesis abundant protein LEA-3 subgroup protein [Dioscorea alata]|uniref:Late embryogenesis abundant protein LEA-3 subgroup protein n=1 Tax=Dioscorea alata TaxID=55571 RepID=A0ACB7VQL6_DIOAL|nr:Late embryogenesis abundant protein LEA-3 subgroup protein [Dioscorea alata]
MARSLLLKNLFTTFSRRGYSGMASEVERKGKVMEEKVVMMNREGSGGVGAGGVVEESWVPDPVTGFYRPANRSVEMDAAELRQMLLSHKYSSRV